MIRIIQQATERDRDYDHSKKACQGTGTNRLDSELDLFSPFIVGKEEKKLFPPTAESFLFQRQWQNKLKDLLKKIKNKKHKLKI